MEYRRLGSAGLKVSALSFGSWVTFGSQLDEDRAFECMKTAYEAGVNFFDNAEAYASGRAETLMGKVIQRAGWKRSDLVISTKLFWGGEGPNNMGLSRKRILEGTDASLKRLGLDYVDLLFAHRPDPDTPIEETVRAMNHVLNQGKAIYWGTSEWTAEQLREAYEIADRDRLIGPQMEQPQYNMFHRRIEDDLKPLYEERGLGTTIWSPLAGGILTGKYSGGTLPEGSRYTVEAFSWMKERQLDSELGQARIRHADVLAGVAKDLDCTLAQLAIAWTLRDPWISTAITGASRPAQVSENMKALEVLKQLDDEVIERIEGILDGSTVTAEKAKA